MVCGLPPGDYSCHGDSKIVNFSLRSAPPQERQVKMYKPGFLVFYSLLQAFPEDLRPSTIVYSREHRIKFLFI
jgi:hypothetical protein